MAKWELIVGNVVQDFEGDEIQQHGEYTRILKDNDAGGRDNPDLVAVIRLGLGHSIRRTAE